MLSADEAVFHWYVLMPQFIGYIGVEGILRPDLLTPSSCTVCWDTVPRALLNGRKSLESPSTHLLQVR